MSDEIQEECAQRLVGAVIAQAIRDAALRGKEAHELRRSARVFLRMLSEPRRTKAFEAVEELRNRDQGRTGAKRQKGRMG